MKLQIGNATLYRGDCAYWLPIIGPVSALVTDPPYLFSTSGGGKFRKARKNMELIEAAGINKGFDISIIDTSLYNSIVMFCHENQFLELGLYLKERYRRISGLGWRKTNPIPFANKSYQAEVEPYLHAWNKGFHPVGTIEDRKRIFDYKNGKSEYNHPTVKPLEVMHKIMRNVNADIVLDPFAGTGSTGVSALMHGKKFIGIEKDPVVFNIMCARICEFYATHSI